MSPVNEGEILVKGLGGGHFELLVPEKVMMVTIYNLSGSMLIRSKYSDSFSANIDISAEPSGFYIVNIIGEEGSNYSLKLHR